MLVVLVAMQTGVRLEIGLRISSVAKHDKARMGRLTVKMAGIEVYLGLLSSAGIAWNLDNVVVSAAAARATQVIVCAHS